MTCRAAWYNSRHLEDIDREFASETAMKHLQQRLGHVSVTPEGPVVAGSVGEWTITYTVGSYGIDEEIGRAHV